jgi:hypothetical protein
VRACVCERERETETENLKAWENSGSTILQEVDAHYHIAVNRFFIIKNIIINIGRKTNNLIVKSHVYNMPFLSHHIDLNSERLVLLETSQ